MYKVSLTVGNNSQSMRQSTLPFKKEQKVPERDDQFKRKGLGTSRYLTTRRPKPLSNHKGDSVVHNNNSVGVLSEHTSTPDKKDTKRGGRAQLMRDAKSKKRHRCYSLLLKVSSTSKWMKLTQPLPKPT